MIKKMSRSRKQKTGEPADKRWSEIARSDKPIRDAILQVLKENPQLWQKIVDRWTKPKQATKSGRKK